LASGSQTWVHIGIAWGAFKNSDTQAIPQTLKQ
jgi:hypothetical protein